MKKYLIGLAIIFLSLNIFAGSNTAKLTCKSASGKTIFIAYLQDITGGITGGEFTIEGESFDLSHTEDKTIFSPKDGVFTIFINIKDDESYSGDAIQFWAIPSTFKITKDENWSHEYKFQAYIQGSDPREGKNYSPKIKLSCTLEYSI